MGERRRFGDCHILIVEDEFFLATELEEELRSAGAIVVGPASSVAAALALIEQSPHLDGAMLDVNLAGEQAFPVADTLRERDVPFMFITGYQMRDMPAAYAKTPRVEKPVARGSVAAALARLLAIEA